MAIKSRAIDGVDHARTIPCDRRRDFIQGMRDYKEMDQFWREFGGQKDLVPANDDAERRC